MVRQQGFVIASVRTYLGVFDDTDGWMFSGYIVGIEKENGVIEDYLTKEEYSYITRTQSGKLNISREHIEIGNIYAIESLGKGLDKNQLYSDSEIKRFIRRTSLFSDEYKEMTKPKMMIRK